MEFSSVKSIFIIVTVLSHQLLVASKKSLGIGINYGLNGNDLPTPATVVSFLKTKGIDRIRIFEPNHDVLEALRGSGITVSLGVRNEDIARFANSQEACIDWLNTNIVPYYNDVQIVWITVANEVIPGEYAAYVAPGMRNLVGALKTLGLGNIVVTTVVSAAVLSESYPPSAGVFTDQNMLDVVNFLNSEKLPLMVNVYPYFALASNPKEINLDHALLNSNAPAVMDGNLTYNNLFDAIYDAFLAAIEKAVGKADIQVIVSETGWPSAGAEPYATVENARTYNQNLKNHAPNGSPRYRGFINVFFFALFNENLKPQGVEQNFGSFLPNMEPVYALW